VPSFTKGVSHEPGQHTGLFLNLPLRKIRVISTIPYVVVNESTSHNEWIYMNGEFHPNPSLNITAIQIK
jgi:hypothetical protein